ncbi:DUF4974 domain-containing protein [Dyadobacter flavalbus]|uniref:DUF4974 domain-containing protein n=1 Tax=Dyadobacter flavalbus TaxID=2579942 RepID=A0A5M8QVH4_9BACT|nr:FecR domain-containing protein [Dyadobacter flavalbus]KAA6439298.1 DUF4974 domain-containing protein [Dyadobacter flavalbus]
MKKRLRKSPASLPSAGLSEEDEKVAARTRTLMQWLREESLPGPEKEALRLRIEDTISQKTERSFSSSWIAMAASIALLLMAGAGYLLLRQNTGSAMQEVASKLASDAVETRLQLADKRIIRLSEQNASLVYEKNGARIQIDSASVIEQQIAGRDQQFNTLTVPYGKRSTITLIDGTKIWLNSGSKLVYPAQFDDDTREVYLEGQAYFSVAHSDEAPFYVHSKHMKIRVLGTEFDISAYDDDVQTSAVLVKGSIELTANPNALFGAKNQKISPGTMAVFTPETRELATSQVNVEPYISWKEGYLIFKKAPLPDIFKKLSRYYSADIQLGSTTARDVTFSGTLDLGEDITLVLESIAITTSLKYQQTERRFIFR